MIVRRVWRSPGKTCPVAARCLHNGRWLGVLLMFWGMTSIAAAETRYVAPQGSDNNPGTVTQPWRTLQFAADSLAPGDTCLIRPGVYRETIVISASGTRAAPIRFQAAVPQTVVIHGGDLVDAKWEPHDGEIQRAVVRAPVAQLFVGNEQQTWARWPNRQSEKFWAPENWASADAGSRYGELVDSELVASGIDWTGAVAVLNVAHQFCTWTRLVDRCDLERGVIQYERNLSSLSNYEQRTKEWEDDRYYITGALAALDAPGEWYFDDASETLYFWPPVGCKLDEEPVSVKRRYVGVEVQDAQFVELVGLQFVGCTVVVRGENNVIADCRLNYPIFAQRLDEPGFESDINAALIHGNDNTVRNCTFEFSNATALSIYGTGNLVEDCTIDNACWDGSLKTPAISVVNPENGGPGNTVRHCDVYNSGGVLLRHSGPENIIEFCHLFNGGLCSKDVALLHGGSPRLEGTVLRYNWVHGCHAYAFSQRHPGGLGIRGDDQTRGLIVHHNVVWDCGRDGIIVKGDRNQVYHNTVFQIGGPSFPGNALSLHREAEPYKPWLPQVELLAEQNVGTQAHNNASTSFTADRKGTPFPPRAGVEHNVVLSLSEMRLVDPENFDFRPQADSPLVDAGREVPGLGGVYAGKAPDVGAYELNGPAWVPGRRDQEMNEAEHSSTVSDVLDAREVCEHERDLK